MWHNPVNTLKDIEWYTLKMVNCMVCELYLNKAVKNKRTLVNNVLVCHNKSTTNWVGVKVEKFLSHSSGG